jgi:hypothetical protein
VWWLRPLLCYSEYTYDCKLNKIPRNVIDDFKTKRPRGLVLQYRRPQELLLPYIRPIRLVLQCRMLLTTLTHNQHDVIDVMWRLPVWNVKIIRYLASCTLQFWSNLTKISFQGKNWYVKISEFISQINPHNSHLSI